MKNISQISLSVLNIFLTTGVLIALPAVFLTVVTSQTDALWKIKSFIVATGSMEPKIPLGSIVFTRPQTSYHTGDIITFKRGDISVTHRVVGFESDKIVTKGDANKTPDRQLVQKSNITGKNFLVVPYVGRLSNFLRTVQGFTMLVILPIFIHILLEARTIKKEWEKKIEEKVITRYKLGFYEN